MTCSVCGAKIAAVHYWRDELPVCSQACASGELPAEDEFWDDDEAESLRDMQFHLIAIQRQTDYDDGIIWDDDH